MGKRSLIGCHCGPVNGTDRGCETGVVNLYECEMMFKATVGLKEINDVLEQCGFDESLQIKDALNITVTQTLPEIPDETYLQSIAKIIRENYKSDKLTITACRFSGYKNIRVIKPKEA